MSRDAVSSLLAELRQRDVQLELRGDRIHVDAPKGVLSDTDRAALRSERAKLRSRLRLEASFVGMSFREYGRAHFAVKLAVPWMRRHLWLVPDTSYLDQLLDRGVDRGCIWTAADLIDLYRIEQLREDDRRAIALLKAHFNIKILSVEDWSESGDRPPETIR